MQKLIRRLTFPWSKEVPAWAIELKNLILKMERNMSSATDALVAAAKRLTKDNTEMLAVLQTTRDSQAAQAVQLQAALDQLRAIPADTAAQEAIISGVVTQLTDSATAIETNIAANSAVPNLPPAPAPVLDPSTVQQ